MLGLASHEPYFYILRETIMTPLERKKVEDTINLEGREKTGQFGEK